MRLITDGGSTKCDWVLLDDNGNIHLRATTKGLNPALLHKPELVARITENPHLQTVCNDVEKLEFFGAGCGTPIPAAALKSVLQEVFSKAKVRVREDMVGAVFATSTQPGIVCILGTGSNSCYFDGEIVHTPIPSLGYIFMDEASGKYLGRRLIRDYYYKQMPDHIADAFEKENNLDADVIKSTVYQKPHPNAYIASFAEFIFKSPAFKKEPYFHQIIEEGITEFIKCRILTFEHATQLPIHFVGSIAYFSQDIIKESLLKYNLKPGNFVRRPIDGMIEYFKSK